MKKMKEVKEMKEMKRDGTVIRNARARMSFRGPAGERLCRI